MNNYCTSDAYYLAAKDNDFELVKLIATKRVNGNPIMCQKHVVEIVASFGNCAFVKWLCKTRPEYDTSSRLYLGVSAKTFENAARNGHLDILNYLVDNRPEFDPTSPFYVGVEEMQSAIDNSLCGDKLFVANWIYLHSHVFSLAALSAAIKADDFEAVRWYMTVQLYASGDPFSIILSECLRNDRFRIFKWVVEIDPGYKKKIKEYAMDPLLNECFGYKFSHTNLVHEWLNENIEGYAHISTTILEVDK